MRVIMDTKTYTIGEIVMRKGEKAVNACRIVEGSAHVYLDKDEKIVTLANLREGAIFGEMALLQNRITNANIQAGEHGLTVELITKQDLAERLEQSDPLIGQILKSVVHRLDTVNEALLKSETREFIEVDLI